MRSIPGNCRREGIELGELARMEGEAEGDTCGGTLDESDGDAEGDIEALGPLSDTDTLRVLSGGMRGEERADRTVRDFARLKNFESTEELEDEERVEDMDCGVLEVGTAADK